MNLKTLITNAALALVLVAGFAASSQAQTLIDNTTLSATVTATQNSIVLGSVTCTNCTFGQDILIYVEREAMRVTGAYPGSGTTVPVRRGTDGTQAAPHVSSSVVFLGLANRFKLSATGFGNGDPQGNCTRATQPFLPWINVLSGNVWNCEGDNHWRGTNPAPLAYSSGPKSGAVTGATLTVP